MHTTLYIVRHCQAEGQQPDAPLTPLGRLQADTLADFLSAYRIGRIISSPFVRATRSIMPLARRLDLRIETDARLEERVLCASMLPDWLDRLRDTFTNMDLRYEGGESSSAAMSRGVAVIQEILQQPGTTTVIVSHGNLIALLLKHFDARFGFELWSSLTNPDLYRVTVEDNESRVERLWPAAT